MSIPSRRQFLATAAGVSLLGHGSTGRAAANERITLGFIGLGERGMHLLEACLIEPDIQVVAICDVADRHYRERRWGEGKSLGRLPARERVLAASAAAPAVVTDDFREVCGQQGLDAVVIATPDHWHAVCTVEAIRHGKDVYCEKPVTHRFAEGQAICRAVAERETIFQTGSQQRSTPEFRRACELIRNGLLGDLERIEVGLPPGYEKPMGSIEIQQPPDAAIYERWCGPAPRLPYMQARYHRWWRGHTAFGGGVLMDWIGHHNDIAHWSLDLDASGPQTVETTLWTLASTPVYDTPWHYTIACTYPGGIRSTISDAHPVGTKWIGREGWIHVSRGRLTASDTRWLADDFVAGSFRLPPATSHVRDFLDGVRLRRACIAPAAVGHRSITPGHLGFVSQAVGRPLTWDAAAERILDDPEAQRLLDRNEYRPPWSLTG
jgi:predicted dehydrogenase